MWARENHCRKTYHSLNIRLTIQYFIHFWRLFDSIGRTEKNHWINRATRMASIHSIHHWSFSATIGHRHLSILLHFERLTTIHPHPTFLIPVVTPLDTVLSPLSHEIHHRMRYVNSLKMGSQHTSVVSPLFRPLYHQRRLRFLIGVSTLTSKSTDYFGISISDPVRLPTPSPPVQPNTTSEAASNIRIRVSFTPTHSLFRILPSLSVF